jgi:hypothetical protein
MPSIQLSESEIAAVMRAAQPLPTNVRDAFLRDVARAIVELPVRGPGIVHRLIREVQRKHFDAPDLSVGKYD